MRVRTRNTDDTRTMNSSLASCRVFDVCVDSYLHRQFSFSRGACCICLRLLQASFAMLPVSGMSHQTGRAVQAKINDIKCARVPLKPAAPTVLVNALTWRSRLWKLGQGSRASGKEWGTKRRGLDYIGVLLLPPAACHHALDTTQQLHSKTTFSKVRKAGSPSCTPDDVLPNNMSNTGSPKPYSVSKALFCAI